MTQSRRMSLIEAVTNVALGYALVALGYALAVATQIMVFPWFGLHPSLGENLALGGIFTAISLVRGYALRRLFEAIRVASLR
ncbi:hypothetical protein ACEYYA_12945 [Paracoccus sp. p3-h83]|uniref:DUF7220 family protein n=1 Tax=Paracoccus sp. p3-h83 TaxID=3342805 RepID=UPI0035BA92A8